uniref:Uncharacterized protein n=1 Tax=Setaria italica TaxID=4555 RepID=K3Y448_SETIT
MSIMKFFFHMITLLFITNFLLMCCLVKRGFL